VADSALRARGVDPARWDRTLQAVRYRASSSGASCATPGTRGSGRRGAPAGGTYLVPAFWEARYVRRGGTLAERGEEWRVTVRPDGALGRVSHVLPDDAPGAAPPPDQARALATAAARGVAGPAPLREVELTQRPRPRRLDTRAEFVDPSVALPGGATARVAVELAGAEVAEAGRLVRLPEAWLRRDADRASRRTLAGSIATLLLGGGAIALLARAVRRRPDPARPPVVTRRTATLVGLAAALATLAASINQLPLALAGWRTETPWSTFVQTAVLGVVLGAAVFGLAIGGCGPWPTRSAGVRACRSGRRRPGARYWPARPSAPPRRSRRSARGWCTAPGGPSPPAPPSTSCCRGRPGSSRPRAVRSPRRRWRFRRWCSPRGSAPRGPA
jgi:hypothetical protein